MYRPDQECVEYGEQQEGNEDEEDHRQPVVDELVQVVAAQLGVGHLHGGRVGGRVATLEDLVLEWGRNREPKAHDEHTEYEFAGARLSAQHFAFHRVAHSDVSVGGQSGPTETDKNSIIALVV